MSGHGSLGPFKTHLDASVIFFLQILNWNMGKLSDLKEFIVSSLFFFFCDGSVPRANFPF